MMSLRVSMRQLSFTYSLGYIKPSNSTYKYIGMLRPAQLRILSSMSRTIRGFFFGMFLFSLGLPSLSYAGDVQIIDVLVKQRGQSWNIRVMLQHEDTGWEHYADAWRVVAEDGKVLGKKLFQGPHVEEQPFARSLNLKIPRSIHKFYIEAHDSVHGWSINKVHINLDMQEGRRYRVVR